MELAVLVPIFGLLIVAVVAAGRLGTAREQVEQAARDAARAASLATTPAAAQQAARQAAAGSLTGGDCPTWTLTLNTAGLTAPVGQPGVVTATLTCQVPTGDLSVLPLPGHVAMTSTFSAPVDAYRARALAFTNPAYRSGIPTGGRRP